MHQKCLYFLCINCVSRSSELAFGDRCLATYKVKALFPNQNQHPASLVPEKLIKKDVDLKTRLTSGPEISTPTVSSRKELIKELLEIITEINEDAWKTQDGLDLSMISCDSSSANTTSSSEDEWEVTPQNPPLGGLEPKKKKFKYVNFCKQHGYECDDNDK
nr:ORF3 [Torque teno felis virus]